MAIDKYRMNEMARANYRRLKQSWKLYKESTVGIIGLGIVLAFVVLAILTPFIAPYSQGFTAPTQDEYIAQRVSNISFSSPVIASPLVIGASGTYTNYAYLATKNGMIYEYNVLNHTKVWSYNTNINNAEGFSYGFAETLALGSSTNPIYLVGDVYNSSGYISIFYASFIPNGNYIKKPIFLTQVKLNGVFTSNPLFNAPTDPIATSTYFSKTNFAGSYGLQLYALSNSGTLYGMNLTINTKTITSNNMWVSHITNSYTHSFFVYGTPSGYTAPLPANMPKNAPYPTQMIAIPANDGYLYNVNATNGHVLWKLNLGKNISANTTISTLYNNEVSHSDSSNNNVFFATPNVYILTLSNGSIISVPIFVNYTTQNSANYIKIILTQYYPITAMEFATESNSMLIFSNLTHTEYMVQLTLKSNYSISVSSPVFSYTISGTSYVPAYYDPVGNRIFIEESNGNLLNIGLNGSNSVINWVISIPSLRNYQPVLIRLLGISNKSIDEVLLVEPDGSVAAYSATGISMLALYGGLPPGKYPSGNYYLLGTTPHGRDVWTLFLWGTVNDLVLGLVAAALTILLSILIGITAGYIGGRTDAILMRFTDVMLSLPFLPLLIVLTFVLPQGPLTLLLALTIVSWPGIARIIRSQVLSLKERTYIDSARLSGASSTRIMFKHLAPNVMPITLLYLTFTVGGTIVSITALAFLGLVSPTFTTWGLLLYDAETAGNYAVSWWLVYPAGFAVTLLTMGFFLITRGFDGIVNPRLRRR
jgi:peptide/nickel transport system permease protein